jgi:hypothetical protein
MMKKQYISVRLDVLMAAGMQVAVFWVVAPCSLVEVYQCFRDACCLHRQSSEHVEGSKHL